MAIERQNEKPNVLVPLMTHFLALLTSGIFILHWAPLLGPSPDSPCSSREQSLSYWKYTTIPVLGLPAFWISGRVASLYR